MSEQRTVRVRDVMTKRFQLVDGLTTVHDGIRIMKDNKVRALIVNKRHDDDEYGLVLLSDIAKNVLATNRSPERVSIYEIMSKPIICVDPKMDIRYCARLFEHFGLAIAPVIDDHEVIGVVSYHEIVLNGLVEAD